MTRNRTSTLGGYSDIVIPVNVEREACPLDVAPTSSTTLTLALGDALAVCLMKAKNFEKEDFASFHPGGALGKRLFVKVQDLMRREDLPIVREDTPIKKAIVTISEGRLGTALLINQERQLTGLISDGDIRRALMQTGFSLDAPSKLYATMQPKTITDSNMLASDALVLLEEQKIQLLVIIDEEQKIQGVLHLHTLVEAGIS